MSLTARLRPAKASQSDPEAVPLSGQDGTLPSPLQPDVAQPPTAQPEAGTVVPQPPSAGLADATQPSPAHIEDLWQPKGKARAREAARGRAPKVSGPKEGRPKEGRPKVLRAKVLRAKVPRAGGEKAKAAPSLSGTGIALDGAVATRARVDSGQVVSYEVFRADSASNALALALSGTKGAQVVCADDILFAPSAGALAGQAKVSPLTLVEVGKRTWPASTLAAVAGMVDSTGRGPLVGWEAQGFSWAAVDKAGARLVGLPLVLPDGAWLVVGAEHSWFALVEGDQPVLCRELKAGAADFGQVAAQASVEVARLAREGRAMGDVHVLGALLDAQATSALARVGIRGVPPVVPGVSRWEIPWAEQGPAGLAALAALARPAPSAWWRSPAELARLAEAPAKHRRMAVLGAGGAVVVGVALVGILPLVSARSALSNARSALAVASSNKASVSRWLTMRSEVLSLSAQARSDRAPDAAYVPAVLEVAETAPPQTSIGSVNLAPAGGQLSLNVSATVLGTSFVPVAAWQSRLQHLGATVVISGESTNAKQVEVSMTVVVPPPRTRAPATLAKPTVRVAPPSPHTRAPAPKALTHRRPSRTKAPVQKAPGGRR